MINNSFDEILTEIGRAKNIVMFLHVGPDMDSFGSTMAFATTFRGLGKNVDVFAEDAVPYFLAQVYPENGIKGLSKIAEIDYAKYDLLVCLDLNGHDRYTKHKDFQVPQSLKKINLDHHADNKYWGDLNYVDTNASSASYIFWDFAKYAGLALGLDVAEFVLLGVMGDTGYLRFGTTKPADFRLVAEIVEMGLSLDAFHKKLNGETDIDEFRVKRVIYSNLTAVFDRQIAYTWTTVAGLKALGVKDEIIMGNISSQAAMALRSLRGVKVIFAVSQDFAEPTTWKLSFRSHNDTYDVSQLAVLFGGGGHKYAAGAFVNGYDSVEGVLEFVLKTLEEFWV
jgi:phosphoesterase RecJ-like protein